MNFPFIDKAGRVVGWTSTSPEFVGGTIHHPEAAGHFPGPLAPNYVELSDLSHLAQAGAPAGWTDPWRCIGLCEVASGQEKPVMRAAAPFAFSNGHLQNHPKLFRISARGFDLPVLLHSKGSLSELIGVAT